VVFIYRNIKKSKHLNPPLPPAIAGQALQGGELLQNTSSRLSLNTILPAHNYS
jgi:hypothetical protein